MLEQLFYKIGLLRETQNGIFIPESFSFPSRILQVLVELYRQYFPEKWQSSEVSLELPSGQEHGYTPRELEFLNLCQALFPFSSEYLEEMAEEGEYSTEIPVYSLEIDWYDTAPSDFAPCLQILLLLAGCASPEQLTLPVEYSQILLHLEEFNREVVMEREAYLPPRLDSYLESYTSRSSPAEEWSPYFGSDNKRLKELCQLRDDPLAQLPLALDAIFHQTGCAMLDASDEMPIEAFWDKENLDWLAQETRQAEETWQKMEELGNWLLADPAHLEVAFELWKVLYRVPLREEGAVPGEEKTG
ncbi:MAG: hypothetical protein HXX08_14280 [Chloroflexi bacterium]|uniref:Uncharacterized protein n=1 Tax=Candidatus Chlorohelix allophototropha TaxID=3003348 RepID=A0A8T7M4N3_9CHLR|nr:hypothetical protein [Chloroflexota bacterium]WJW70341.1 hypothetical protein OZ401_004911 [Chloroflexota bacterium L227-S17]